MMLSLSVHLASIGRCSATWTPGSVVGMVLNSPRTSAGASGLGSRVSWWVGPPCIHNRMHLMERRSRTGWAAWRRRKESSDRPRVARPPTRRKVRREKPVQSEECPVIRSSMAALPQGGNGMAGRWSLHLCLLRVTKFPPKSTEKFAGGQQISSSGLAPQLCPDLHQDLPQPIHPGAVAAIAPVGIVDRVLDQQGVAGAEQDRLQVVVLGELRPDGFEHHL